MQTVKTAIVVVLLATVVYSAWVALTAPPAEMPQELAQIVEGVEGGDFNLDDIDIGITDGTSGDPMLPPEILAGESAGNSDASAGGLPPTLAASDSVPGASDYYPPGTYDMSEGNTSANAGAASSSAATASARLSDGGPSAGPSMNFGYEIPPNPNSQPKAPAGAADATTANSSATPAQPSPGGFSLPEDYSTTPYSATQNDYASGESSEAASNSAATPPTPDSTAAGEVARENTADSSTTNRTALANAIATADRQQQQDQLREALTTLSLFYNSPSLGPEERTAMLGRLDYLAGEVIYSKRHLLEQPYRVSNGETLETIAATLDIPWQLLATINQVSDPAKVVPGQDLKVVRGPFRAEVNLGRGELTLMLGELYAGRFPLSVGQDPAPQPGDYTIRDKQRSRTYYALGGANIPAGDARNPYGDVWLDLGNQMCIHGSAQSSASAEMGCIRLAPSDARDVYGILSQGSSVVIMR